MTNHQPMRRRIFGALFWLLLLPVVGSGRLLWQGLRGLARLRLQTILMLVGLPVALSLPSPVQEQLAQAGVWPPGHMLLGRAALILAVLVLYHGLRSPSIWRLRRRLLR